MMSRFLLLCFLCALYAHVCFGFSRLRQFSGSTRAIRHGILDIRVFDTQVGRLGTVGLASESADAPASQASPSGSASGADTGSTGSRKRKKRKIPSSFVVDDYVSDYTNDNIDVSTEFTNATPEGEGEEGSFNSFNNESNTDEDEDEDEESGFGEFSFTDNSGNTFQFDQFDPMSLNGLGQREGDDLQGRDLDLILTERAERFNVPFDSTSHAVSEKCLLVAVDIKQRDKRSAAQRQKGVGIGGEEGQFTVKESLSELSELVGTAGLQVMGTCIQKMNSPNLRTFVGPGKISELMLACNQTGARTLVVDDDLTPKQQRSLETELATMGGSDVKVLDRTAVILEIFAQHASTKEGQLQVELAQLQYRLTRGPSARARDDASDRDSGAGFRGPGETRVETDKRAIRDKIVQIKRELGSAGSHREQHRKGRERLGLPLVALIGYTNAGKSTVMNKLSLAGVLAENMLFATLDNTVRKVQLLKGDAYHKQHKNSDTYTSAAATTGTGIDENIGTISLESSDSSDNVDSIDVGRTGGGGSKGPEILLTDTVGFISKLPTDLVVAFRATLEELRGADVLVHVIDRSSPVWEKQRETVLREIEAVGCADTPVVELWNKLDNFGEEQRIQVQREARTLALEIDALELEVMEEQEGIVESWGADSRVSGSLPSPTDTQIHSRLGVGVGEDSDNAVHNNDNSDDDDDDEYGYVTAESSPLEMQQQDQKAQKGNKAKAKAKRGQDEAWLKDAEEYRRKLREKGNRRGSSSSSVNKDNDVDTLTLEGIGIDEDNKGAREQLALVNVSTTTAGGGYVSTDNTVIAIDNTIDSGKSKSKSKSKSPSIYDYDRRVSGRASRSRHTYVVASSAKTGENFPAFVDVLNDALSLRLDTLRVYVPYAQDEGVIASIHAQGQVDAIQYGSAGTYVACRVPQSMALRLEAFAVASDAPVL